MHILANASNIFLKHKLPHFPWFFIGSQFLIHIFDSQYWKLGAPVLVNLLKSNYSKLFVMSRTHLNFFPTHTIYLNVGRTRVCVFQKKNKSRYTYIHLWICTQAWRRKIASYKRSTNAATNAAAVAAAVSYRLFHTQKHSKRNHNWCAHACNMWIHSSVRATNINIQIKSSSDNTYTFNAMCRHIEKWFV